MELSHTLRNLIADIDGVADVYPPRSLLARARGRAGALAGGSLDVSPVLVKDVGDSVAVEVRIGVLLSRPAPETAEAVAAAIEAQVRLARPEVSAVDVDVQICAVTHAEA